MPRNSVFLRCVALAALCAGRSATVVSADDDASDWMSEDERAEAYGTASSYNTNNIDAPSTPRTRHKIQVKLDPLQVCLFPTYLDLPEEVLQLDLRHSLQVLVSEELEKDLGDDFVYFAFTDASIDWYSGEQHSVCGSLRHKLPESVQRDASGAPPSPAQPCTCALYSGALVMLQHNGGGLATPETASKDVLEPRIAGLLEDGLVGSLRTRPSSEELYVTNGDHDVPFYTELRGTSVSWTAAKRQQGGRLVVPPSGGDNEQQQLAPAQQQPPADAPVSIVLDGSTKVDVVNFNALEGSDLETARAGAFSTTRGKILASALGSCVLVSLVAIFAGLRSNRKKKRRERARNGDGTFNLGAPSPTKTNDTSSVRSLDDVDEEIARGGGRRARKNHHEDTYLEEIHFADDSGSEAAQYKRESNLLDNISVGSEWTLTTGVTDGVSSSSFLGGVGGGGGGGYGNNANNKTRAEMLAAKETFDRDRQITLQKDMLQSEWSGGGGHDTVLHHQAPPRAVVADDEAARGGNALQFEEATGQGEEIFLMPTTPRARLQR
mmetsp:Transcript_26584/g.54904  ORF Transcript_26584/g.54904 Transcript_26584/m.54904 type:complete len:550 (-) Transcript_26584:942-2591(-)